MKPIQLNTLLSSICNAKLLHHPIEMEQYCNTQCVSSFMSQCRSSCTHFNEEKQRSTSQDVAGTAKTRRAMDYNKGRVCKIPSHQSKMLNLSVATTEGNFQCASHSTRNVGVISRVRKRHLRVWYICPHTILTLKTSKKQVFVRAPGWAYYRNFLRKNGGKWGKVGGNGGTGGKIGEKGETMGGGGRPVLECPAHEFAI